MSQLLTRIISGWFVTYYKRQIQKNLTELNSIKKFPKIFREFFKNFQNNIKKFTKVFKKFEKCFFANFQKNIFPSRNKMLFQVLFWETSFLTTVPNTVLCTPSFFMFKLKQGEENMFSWNNPRLKHWLCAFYFCDELPNPISEWRRISISKTHENAMRSQHTESWKSATSSFWHKTTWIVLEFYLHCIFTTFEFWVSPVGSE